VKPGSGDGKGPWAVVSNATGPPDVSVRRATRAEAEKFWQSPLHSGWSQAKDNPTLGIYLVNPACCSACAHGKPCKGKRNPGGPLPAWMERGHPVKVGGSAGFIYGLEPYYRGGSVLVVLKRDNGIHRFPWQSVKPMKRKRNPTDDEVMRQLERDAQASDAVARERLLAMRARATGNTSQVDEMIVVEATMGLKPSYKGLGAATRFVEASKWTGITPARWEAAKERLKAKRVLNKAGALVGGYEAGKRFMAAGGTEHLAGGNTLQTLGGLLGIDGYRHYSDSSEYDLKRAFDKHYEGRTP
jgi:hypothetical protein